MVEVEYDEALWVTMDHCKGKHYILGNPHTFPGRILLWCPKKERSFFGSKKDFSQVSKVAKYWIQGFLAGNEPYAPTDADGDVNFESKEYAAWEEKVKEFHKTGYWYVDIGQDT